MRSAFTAALIALALACIAPPALAAPAPPLAVQLAPDGVPAWQAEALAVTIARELATERLRGVTVQGALAPRALRFAIVTRPGAAPVRRGTIAVAGLEPRDVARAVRSELDRALGPAADAAAVDRPPVVEAASGFAAIALVALALLLASPVWSARGVAGSRALRSAAIAAAICVAAAAALALAGDRVAAASWAIVAGGGLAWGTWIALAIPAVFPPLPGLHRVEPPELVGLLGAWLALVVQRLVAFALVHAPVVAAVVLAIVVGDVPIAIAAGVIAPVAALAWRLWLDAWTAVLARRLDAAVVEGPATTDNPWHAAVRGYVVGYTRRAGTDVRLPDDLLFLPGSRDEVVVYGGSGGEHARIVIGRDLLERALAPYGRPHDYQAPRVSTLHWTQWNAGLVVPTEIGATVATAEQRQPRWTTIEGEAVHEALGEPPTLAGIVEPAQLDPRTAFRPTEDPMWLAWDPGEEHDGTDPGDKDFLFGAVVHALGRVRRHEGRAATLGLATRDALARRPRLARVVERTRALLAGPHEAVGDAHAGLDLARDHLAQYLAWQLWRREDLLTARAYRPELARRTREIVQHLGADTGGAGDPAARRRLIRLAARVQPGAAVVQRRRRWRRLVLAGCGAAAIAAVAIAVVRAIDYRAVYAARMEQGDGQGR